MTNYNDGRVKVLRANLAATGTALTACIPAASGYAYDITQLCLHEKNNTSSNVSLYFGNDFFFDMTIGASGTIVWDMPIPQDMPIGSGLFVALNPAGNVNVLARYIKRDERTPTNLNPATYIPTVRRRPNEFGGQ